MPRAMASESLDPIDLKLLLRATSLGSWSLLELTCILWETLNAETLIRYHCTFLGRIFFHLGFQAVKARRTETRKSHKSQLHRYLFWAVLQYI